MKIKSLLLLVMLLIVATFTLASCDAIDGAMDSVGNVVDDVVDKMGDLPFIGDLPFFDDAETTTAPNTTTAPVTTTEPVTTTAPVTTTEPSDEPEQPTPVDPFKDVALADGEFTYDGAAKSLTVIGAPEGASVSYAYTKGGATVDAAIGAGTYTVTATVTLDGESVEKTATLTINKKKVAVGATLADGTAVYTGAVMTHEVATGFDADLFTVAYTYSAEMINAGQYTVTATFALKDADNYEIDGAAAVTADFEITKATVDLSGIAFPAAGTNYFKGQPFTYEVENIPEGVALEKYTYILNGDEVEALEAVGQYTVTATFTSDNYVIPEGFKVEGEFEILKTLADFTGVNLNKLTLVYNGKAQEYVVENLPAGITATCSYTLGGMAANPVGVNTYAVLIKFTSDGYTIPDEWKMKDAELEIVPQKVGLSGVEFLGGAFVYDGTVKAYTPATGYDTTVFNVAYTVEGDQTKAGGFTVTATFSLVDTVNYELEGNNVITATYTIAKQKVSVGATMADGSAVYTGTAMTYEAAAGFDANLFEVAYSYNGDMTNAGKNTVTATFTLKDKDNYELEGSNILTAEFVIDPAPVKVEATLAGATYTYDGEEKPYNEAVYNTELFSVAYSVVGDRTNAGSFTVTATFTLKSDNYVIEGDATVSATYVIEKAAIEGFENIVFADSKNNVYTGQEQTHVATALPEGVSVTYEYKLQNGETVDKMINVGTYTVVATFKLDDNHVEPTASVTYEIVAKEVPIEGLELVWNIEGATKFGDNYAFKTDGKTACTMTLVNETVLAANGITVTYETVMKAPTSFEEDTVVTGDATAYGTYETVATFAAANANYKLVGETTMETLWGIYDEVWSPIVK